MKKETLNKLYSWFHGFAKSFRPPDNEIRTMINIKEEHSLLVADYCRQLSASLGLSDEDVRLAEAIGLCHDAGRFKQAVVYRTFKDHLSVNHGHFGVEQLAAEGIHTVLEQTEWPIFAFAVKNHNAMKLPREADDRALTFLKIVRDADKLDIYRVLPPRPPGKGCTPALLNSVLSDRFMRFEDIKTTDDRNLIMVSWIYDINYPWTLRQLRAKGHIDALLAALPPSSLVDALTKQLSAYIAEKIG